MPAPVTSDLLELLRLEEIDTDLYRGLNEKASLNWPALFGGQVTAQALMAATLTVPSGRLPHSLHGYFLRTGRAERPIVFQVDRDRDGKSYSSRHVDARQNGEVIFSMSASFGSPPTQPGGSPPERNWVARVPHIPSPEEVPEFDFLRRFGRAVRMRPLPPEVPYRDGEFAVPSRLWVRSAVDLPADPVIHACLLAYASDIGSGFADGTLDVPRAGPSVDHALWFHAPVRMDEWVLLESWPLKVWGSRGLYSGAAYSEVGELLCVFNQEIVFRTG